MARFGLVLSLTLVLFCAAIASAQDNADNEQGLKPFGSYQWGDIDQVDLMGGNLKVNIPILSYPQRGGKLRLDFLLNYFTPGYTITTTCQVHQPCQHVVRDNLTTPPPLPAGVALQTSIGITEWKSEQVDQARNTTWWLLNMRMPDGSSHTFAQTGSTTWRTIDATGFEFSGTVVPNTVGIITGPDGVQYNAGSGGNWVEQDPNGNQISSNQGTLIDTLGRQIPPSISTTNFSGCMGSRTTTTAYLLNIPAAGGGTSGLKFCYASVLITVGSIADPLGSNNCQEYWICINAYQSRLQSVVLPNGTAWTFSYLDGLGLLSGITYPTGASISYAWNSQDACPNVPGGVEILHSQLTGRTVNLNDGVTPAATWAYSYAYTGYPTFSVTSVVTDPLLNDTVLTGNNINQASCSYYQTQAKYYSGSHTSGQLLKTVNTVNALASSASPFSTGEPVLAEVPISTTTIWPSGLQSQQQTDYDNGFAWSTTTNEPYGTAIYGKDTNTRDYDYGTGSLPLLRTTSKTYMFQGNAAYLTNNLLNLPSQISIFAGASSSGTCGANSAVACTTYGYDETGLQSSSVTEQKVTGESNPGNQTSLHRWLNGSTVSQSPCSVSVSNGYLVSKNVYYDTGEVQQSTDPCGYATTYQYSSTYYGALPTTVTNALSQSATYAYDFDTGLVTSITDPNSQKTTKQYDIMSRLTQVSYPDGGSTGYCYTDMSGSGCTASGPPYEVVITKAISSSLNEVSTASFDGLGRLSQTQLNSDPSGVTYTQTTYDLLGRKYQVYNPTRCSPPTTNCGTETTWGYTTYNYDPLNRVTSVVEQDGSAVSTSYVGNCTTATDEAGHARQSCVDGLGRMTSVLEDPGASPHLNYQTTYQYDALSDLTSVTQNGSNGANARVRSFQYDSLAHLTSAVNPESGQISYGYDADGNVITKTALSPNQGSTGTAKVTTTYTYDTLNRITGKSYNDAYNGSLTPGVTYGYDGVNLSCPTPTGDSGSSAQNGIGRRTAMCFSAGNKSWSFDPMGRIAGEGDRFIGLVAPYNSNVVFTLNGVPTISTNTTYSYYLNGDLYESNAPDWYEYATVENVAGEVTSVGDEFYNVLTLATYAPTRQLAHAWTSGDGTSGAMQISNTYNSRLQPINVSAATSTGVSILNLTYSFNLGNGTSGSDNGNVIQITNGKDSNRTQNFLYDPLNRIWQAYTNGTNWGETYSPTTYAAGTAFSASNAGIDSWGNLTKRSPVTGKTNYESLNCSANAQNQLTACSFQYDPAGNMIQNGSVSYVYDAENRLIATAGNSYVYDGDGNRIEKCTEATNSNGIGIPGTCATNATGTFYWLHRDGGTLTESDLGGNFTEVYDLIHGQIAARIDLPANVVHYYFHDHLGSTNIVTDASGDIQNESDYYPYGGEIVISDSDSNRYKFTGKERDSESGLDNFGARYDASTMGRFMTPDPVVITTERLMNPQQLNLYAYVANNPLRFIDPTGEILQCVGDAKSQSQCFADLQQIAGDAKDRLSMDAKTGVISFDTKDLDLSKNEGASLVNNLVGSTNTYDFSVGPTIMTDKGPVRVDHIGTDMANLPAFGDQRQIGNPPAGVSDILDIYFNNPNMTRVSNTNLQVAPEWTVAFHELAEAYEKIDGGKGGSYAAGHNAALQREMTLRDQRPYLKQYNTGAGGPANSPNPQGGIIIKK